MKPLWEAGARRSLKQGNCKERRLLSSLFGRVESSNSMAQTLVRTLALSHHNRWHCDRSAILVALSELGQNAQCLGLTGGLIYFTSPFYPMSLGLKQSIGLVEGLLEGRCSQHGGQETEGEGRSCEEDTDRQITLRVPNTKPAVTTIIRLPSTSFTLEHTRLLRDINTSTLTSTYGREEARAGRKGKAYSFRAALSLELSRSLNVQVNSHLFKVLSLLT